MLDYLQMILLFSQLLKVKKKLPVRTSSNITHPIIYFNNVQVQKANQQKHLDILDEKLNFKCHIDKRLTKTSKNIAVKKTSKLFTT